MDAEALMTSPIVSVGPDALVTEVARIMLHNAISAVVVMQAGKAIGIVSEGDLLRRTEIGTAPRHSWLGSLLMSEEDLAAEFLRSHGRKARDVMTSPVVTVRKSDEIEAIVETLESYNIKRVVVVDGRVPVGIVSRREILYALVAAKPDYRDDRLTSKQIRDIVMTNIATAGLSSTPLDLRVVGDRAEISAIVPSEIIAHALVAAVEASPGIAEVKNNITVVPQIIGGAV